jgi:leucyl-tRNA synthetase
LKTFEKSGKLKVTLKEKDKFAVIEIQVPPNYPMQPVKLALLDHNFHKVFAQIFVTHATTIVQKLWSGHPAGYDKETKSDINAGKIGFKKAVGKLEADMQRIQIASRAELKHDTDYLKKIAELRNGGLDRTARRALKLSVKHEKKYEEAMRQRDEEAKRMAESLDEFGQLNRTSALTQIYHVVNYLANFFVRFLPTAKCPVCLGDLC